MALTHLVPNLSLVLRVVTVAKLYGYPNSRALPFLCFYSAEDFQENLSNE